MAKTVYYNDTADTVRGITGEILEETISYIRIKSLNKNTNKYDIIKIPMGKVVRIEE